MNKKLRKIFTLFSGIFVLTFFLFFSTACNKKYKVTFIADDEVWKIIEVKKGATVEKVEAPSKEYYAFVDWMDGDNVFDFSTKIKKDYQLTAAYECTCEHDWLDATCVEPERCSICLTTRGEALGHSWVDATYDAPKTCERCGITEGEAIPKPKEIETEFDQVTIYVGQSVQIKAKVFPANASQDIEYSIRYADAGEGTFDEETATFNALHEGIAYLTVNSVDVKYVNKVITINILHPLLEEEVYEAFNIMTGLGNNASTDIEINYHTYNTKSFVEYTTADDPNFGNLSTIAGEGYYFTEGTDIVVAPFTPRNVYRVSLHDLTPNTEYIYRINLGNDTYSEVYHFKTANNDGGDSAFILMSDTHYALTTDADGNEVSHGSEISEQAIQQALALNPNVGFIGTAGDTVDRGGSSKIWNIFFEKSESLKTLPRIGIAGNHEYYIDDKTAQSDGRYQKAHYATANNGPEGQIGLSQYFIYNDILFIAVDNETAAGRDNLLAWMEDLLANKEYRYSIIMMHRPVYHDNTDRDEKFLAIFEKYAVDLVVSGHYHSDDYVANYYEGNISTDQGLGVNYITLSFSGAKSQSDSNKPSVYLFETHDGTIKITRIDIDGKVKSTRTVTSKRNKPVVEDTKENLINSINPVYDSQTATYTINVKNTFYGNVKKMIVVETTREEIKVNMFFPTSSYTSLKITNIIPNYEYNFRITLEFMDGTTEVVEKALNLAPELNLRVSKVTADTASLWYDELDSSLNQIIKYFEVYVNGQKWDEFNYLDEYYYPVTFYRLKNLESNTTYNVTFVAIDRNGKRMFSYDLKDSFTTLEA